MNILTQIYMYRRNVYCYGRYDTCRTPFMHIGNIYGYLIVNFHKCVCIMIVMLVSLSFLVLC